MTTIFVTNPAGLKQAVEATDGHLLMEVLRAGGFGIKGSCEASLSCGTCHIHVEPASMALLPAPGEEEAEMIDLETDGNPASRFSCQIRITPALEGLCVRIPA
ncbi:2Fe-2S iron-sulfur cluster-binding protein [Allorhizobium borbori]|uniref:2Fe-2S ferredoxin n=1 Tax=Allorhizobium borbori TaxID=485907 RepID=A0A7W6K160_9HYPH|nr:2Fe-2S iron-sulfur cluster-binding protein [Allorhizobium borbori]MBB4103273.1 2Fe-2S ferredoxin [Allorhizobium borbori]